MTEQAAEYVALPTSYQRRLYDECATTNWDPERRNTFGEEVSHLHEEVSEAFRAWRVHQDFAIHIDADGKPQGVPIELADVLIGLFYNAELHGFDLLEAVEVKHRFNLTRDYVAEGRQLHARPAQIDGRATDG
jgi:NTP pyrophosphatase (non-canonical NTP hydrolase)